MGLLNDATARIKFLEEQNRNLLQELQRKDNEIKQLREDIVNHIKIAGEYKEQMIIKDNIINNITKYVRTFKTDEITTRELCILNDILLITEEKENIVARLKEKSGK